MKRTFKTILCAAAVVMASVSCQKSAEPVQPAEEGKETIDICVNGLMGEYTQVDQSKAQLVNNVRVSWEGDETVYVFDGVKCLGSLAASLEGDEDRYAVLSTDGAHTVSTPADGTTTLTLVYSPLLTEAPTVNDGAISISLASQSGEKAPFVAYATLDYTSTTITNAVVPFKFATSVIKVNCTGLKANTAITSAKLSNVNTACKLTLSGAGVQNVSGDVNGTITRTGDEYFANTKINDEGEAVFQIAVPKLETASGARVLTVAQSSDKAKDKKFTTKSLNPATSVNTVCQLVGLPVGALEGEFTVSDDDGATTKQIYFSQGNLYYDGSKCNFEANQYDFRTYPGKGSCINGTSSTPSGHYGLFTWSSTVADAVGNSSSGNNLFTNVDGFKVNVDGKEQTGWRTLSTKEWQYLFKTDTPNRMVKGKPCYSNAVSGVTIGGATYKGVFLYPDNYDGEVVSGSMTWDQINAAGIVFLPAAGARMGSYVFDVGGPGRYWSSTALDSNAYDVYFDINGVYPDSFVNRFTGYGFGVRLITDASVTPAPTPTTTGTAKATIGGSQVDVNWVQLWAGGPKFAEYNVGAENNNAEDYGGYYNWGMSEVQTSSNWSSYKSGESPLTGDDDTATALWGSNWRMPTQTELQGLIDNCTVEWTQVNSVNGCKFTGKGAYESNSVFLPAAGRCRYGDVDNQGLYGYYWSSTPKGGDNAYDLFVSSDDQGVSNINRDRGYPVRAVLAEED